MRRTFALLLFACAAASARADPMDDWCRTVKLPSSIAICSDPELRALTAERQQVYDETNARLDPAGQTALLADQTGWVRLYTATCGLAPQRAASATACARDQELHGPPGRPASLISGRTPHRWPRLRGRPRRRQPLR
jgi:hypothetical protein